MSAAKQLTATTASTQIEWTTIVYILIPLALSTMTQPVDSVLDSSPISQMYLRSSPLFCLIDAVLFLVNIFWYWLFTDLSYGHMTFQRAVRTELARRHDTSNGSNITEDL